MDIRFIARAACSRLLRARPRPGLNSLAYGQVQFRVSRDSPLAPSTRRGGRVTLGTAIVNTASPMGLADVVFGRSSRRRHPACTAGPRRWPAVPIVVNGLGVPVELALVLDLPFWYSVLWVTVGEAAVMLTLGIIVLKVVRSGVLWPWGRPHPRG
jgi:uncharacterized membrane protein